jgi:hypothetical protein
MFVRDKGASYHAIAPELKPESLRAGVFASLFKIKYS